jgi:pimeloyl-ACP methyl ester carboxylesterase
VRKLFPLVFVFTLLLPAQSAVAAPAQRTAVILVGGLDSQPSSGSWLILRQALTAQGYADGDVVTFSYDPTSVDYQPQQMCQDIAASKALLAFWVRALRDSHAYSGLVLVGHSLGGVIALQVAGQEPDVAPFLRKVVTVDSPLGGIDTLATLWFDARNDGNCLAAHQLADRWLDGSATTDVMQGLAWSAMGRGVQIRSYVNDADAGIAASLQFVPGTSALEDSWLDGTGLVNHSAALTSGAATADIAAFVGPQGL